MSATAEFTGAADLALAFKAEGKVYVGNLPAEDVLSIIRETGLSADQLRVEAGFLVKDDCSPAYRQVCGASFEAVAAAGERRCHHCRLPAFLHRSDADPVVIT